MKEIMNGDGGKPGDVAETNARNTKAPASESGKVIVYKSDYIDALDPGNNEEASGGLMLMMLLRISLVRKTMILMSHWLISF